MVGQFRFAFEFSLHFDMDSSKAPIGIKWRSNTTFIIATVATGLFTDLFLYGLVVPVLPFMLQDRADIPKEKVQSYVSGMLAAYAGASVTFSFPAGWIADRTSARRTPFLAGLVALLAATIMLAFGHSIAVLVLARVLQGISSGVVWVVGLALVRDSIDSKDLGKIIGSILSIISVGELAAPVLGGVLFEKTGYAGLFGVAGAILFVDIFMRLVVIEKKVAARYGVSDGPSNPREQGSRDEDEDDQGNADEESALLGKNEKESFKIEGEQNKIVRSVPVLYCLSDSRVAVALFMSFVQASTLAMFDATIPTEAQSLLGFNSLESGLLFIALDLPYLILGPVAGYFVDKYGTKPVSVLGFSYLVPVLLLLRLPTSGVTGSDKSTLILWCAMLALNGIGLAIIGSPSIVEASDIVQKYDKENEGFFGENGPYAQLYGFQSIAFNLGLTIGPILGGGLRDSVGYGNGMAVFAAMAGLTAILSFVYIGGKPKSLKKIFSK